MMNYDPERLNGAVEAQNAMLEKAARETYDRLGASQIASASVGQEPKLRERLYEIEKLLSDSTNSIRDGADRLFGPSPASMLSGMGAKPANEPVSEPSLAQIIDRILNLTRSNREEAMRFNRIG